MKVEIGIDPEQLAKKRRTVIATAQEDIPAGAYIEIDTRTGKARVARFGDSTAAAIGEQELER